MFKELALIRGSTSRSNISYRSKEYDSSVEETQFLEIQEYVNHFLPRFVTSKDKILIFAFTVDKIKDLSKFLTCPCYYSELEADDKGAILDSFFTRQEDYYKVLVSSTSLEEGIDYPHVRLVIYVDFIYSFVKFLQGSSKGGRDGRESTSMFFYLKGEDQDREADLANKDKCSIRSYLREATCKQRIIDYFCDNVIIDKCPDNVAKCNLCLQRDDVQEGTI
jgi:superfamily II DNA helicase RecQ